MSTWILVLYIYAGPMAEGDSVAMLQVSGFKSAQECGERGKTSERLTAGSTKVLRFVCLEQKQ